MAKNVFDDNTNCGKPHKKTKKSPYVRRIGADSFPLLSKNSPYELLAAIRENFLLLHSYFPHHGEYKASERVLSFRQIHNSTSTN
jgi:hypothetical protein